MALNIFNIFFANLAVCTAMSQPMKAQQAPRASVKPQAPKAAAAAPAPTDTVIVRLRQGKKLVIVAPTGDFADFKRYDFNNLMSNLDSVYKRHYSEALKRSEISDTVIEMYLKKRQPGKNYYYREYAGVPAPPAVPGVPAPPAHGLVPGQQHEDIVAIDIQRRHAQALRQGKPGEKKEIYNFDSRFYNVVIDSTREDGQTVKTIRILRGPAGTSLRSERTYAKGKPGVTTVAIVKPKRRTTQRLDLNLGLNTYLENGKAPNSNSDHKLDPIGSRYVSIRGLQQTRLGQPGSRHHVMYGLEIAWNNYMFDTDKRIIKDANGVTTFAPVPGVDGLEKSKMTVCNLNVPVMYYYEAPKGLRLGFGTFAGMRLDSYNKVKYSIDGDTRRVRQHNNFNLNDFQYGLRAQVGFREVDIFCNYHLSPLFNSNSGMPDLNTISFGIEF